MKYLYLVAATFVFFTIGCKKKETKSQPTPNTNTSTDGWTELDISSFGALYYPFCMVTDNQGNLYMSNYSSSIYKWDGKNWSVVGSPDLRSSSEAMVRDGNNNIYICGAFGGIDKWDGSNWTMLPKWAEKYNLSFLYTPIAASHTGNVYATFDKTIDPRTHYNIIGKWDGNKWTDLGFPQGDSTKIPTSFITDSQGNLYSTGWGYKINGKDYVAKWDGNKWSELGAGGQFNYSAPIFMMIVDSKDNIYAAGDFKNAKGERIVSKWDGTKWEELGAIQANGQIFQLVIDKKDNLYASGEFTNANGFHYIAKWDGIKWSELGSINADDDIIRLTCDDAGNVYTAGSSRNGKKKGYIAKYSVQ